MCGEKVLVDDGLAKMSEDVSRRIYAVDMESYGFAAACEHRHKPWIVFRGISDYADPKKDDSAHIPASVLAAVTARLFLREVYKVAEERNQF
jgi:nucleoside phosphorylase